MKERRFLLSRRLRQKCVCVKLRSTTPIHKHADTPPPPCCAARSNSQLLWVVLFSFVRNLYVQCMCVCECGAPEMHVQQQQHRRERHDEEEGEGGIEHKVRLGARLCPAPPSQSSDRLSFVINGSSSLQYLSGLVSDSYNVQGLRGSVFERGTRVQRRTFCMKLARRGKSAAVSSERDTIFPVIDHPDLPSPSITTSRLFFHS